ncbi:MAG TPA: DUF6799 domain-containing protein [Anaerolineales bacterium]|nr:DUF6799 domain-containing protein [Anaerolineales bacterium]
MGIKDMILMQDGKMMMRRNGLTAPMQDDMALFDGMRVRMDGIVMMTDGNARMMMDGEGLTMDGRIANLEDIDKGMDPRRTRRSLLFSVIRNGLRLSRLGFFHRNSGH